MTKTKYIIYYAPASKNSANTAKHLLAFIDEMDNLISEWANSIEMRDCYNEFVSKLLKDEIIKVNQQKQG